jgi:CheY-like chemotaxis protein
MFSQVERDGHNLQGGLGIGLNLVKRLTEMHGGTVMGASEGSGSTFTIELPTTNEINEPDNKKQINTGAPEPQVPLTILIADDNQDAADMLREILETGGHVIHVAHEGYEALEKARQYRPDLALLDIGMPGMSGHELAYKIRNELRLQNTVLIAITGWGTQEDRSKSRDFGFDHHLTKPVDFASLNCLLSKLRPSS